MGKWAVVKERFLEGYWYVQMNGTTIITCCSEELATRYALAFNIVDAGVDLLGTTKELLAMWNTRTSDEERIPIAIEMAHFLNSILIANAVEGDKAKEDV